MLYLMTLPRPAQLVSLLLLSMAPLSIQAAVTPAGSTSPPLTTVAITAPVAAANRPMTAQQYIQQQHELRQEVKKMQLQVDQVSAAHQAVVAQNQALQLANDNLSVQVKVLQSEQSAQMFLYGAVTMLIGGVFGLVLGHVMGRRQRRW